MLRMAAQRARRVLAVIYYNTNRRLLAIFSPGHAMEKRPVILYNKATARTLPRGLPCDCFGRCAPPAGYKEAPMNHLRKAAALAASGALCLFAACGSAAGSSSMGA